MDKDFVFLEEAELKEITSFLLLKFNLDFSNYTKTSLGRRLARVYNLYSLKTPLELMNYLQRSEDNLKRFVNEITVNTTEMFRDPEFWKFVRMELLHKLNDFNSIRIWHAGCSTGEEVVSMIITLNELNILQSTKIVATDINLDVLSTTKSYKFKSKDLEVYKSNYLESGGKLNFEDYFLIEGDSLILKEKYRPTNILFKEHNLATGNAFSKFDLILCRNVMIYFDEKLQSKVLKLFKESLFKKSYLAIGRKENVSFLPEAKDLNCINNKEKVYQTLN